MAFIIERDDISTAHYEVICLINDIGIESITEDGEFTLKLSEPVAIHINHPCNEPMILREVGFSRQYMDMYALQLQDPKSTEFTYTYGNRLRDWFGLDQVTEAIRKVARNRTTRRAIMHTWDVQHDNNLQHSPCMQTLQLSLDENVLNMTATFRSNDMLMAWGANAYGLARLLEYCAMHVGVPVGYLETYSINPHVYVLRDADILQRVLSGR